MDVINAVELILKDYNGTFYVLYILLQFRKIRNAIYPKQLTRLLYIGKLYDI